jgi:hypothetical protein
MESGSALKNPRHEAGFFRRAGLHPPSSNGNFSVTAIGAVKLPIGVPQNRRRAAAASARSYFGGCSSPTNQLAHFY